MKNLLYLFLIGVLFSCGGSGEDELNPEEPDVNGEPKEYIVSLGMTGEIEISESPLLGRASSDDLYGIQVYSKTSTTNYVPYAYGLFDDKSKMTINLLEGYQYEFVATMVVNGKNRIDHIGDKYGRPFSINGYQEITNSFCIDTKNDMDGIHSGYANDFGRPNVERFYGTLYDYTPTENGAVTINMKRISFGAKFIAEGLTEGRLKINIQDAPELNINYGQKEVQDIFTFKSHITNDYKIIWTEDNFYEDVNLSVLWEKNDGAIIPLINQDIKFKRNILSTITIKVKDSSVNNGVEINQEGGDLIAGDNITLESETGVENPVEPNI